MGDSKRMLHYVDFDGTLVEHDIWRGTHHIGPPIPVMMEKVKALLAAGEEVVVFTARVSGIWDDKEVARKVVEDWTEQNLGKRLKVTFEKGPWDHCYDDSIHQVVRNTGKTVKEHVLEKIAEQRSQWHPYALVMDDFDELEDFVNKL